MGLNSDCVSIVDGSGLSRHNLMTTDFLSEFLYRVGSGKDRDFIHFLPSPGSGTMSGRLSDLKEMNINAKTGSFSYCSSLSGYIGNNDAYFSIFLNNFTTGNDEISAEVDDILRSFLDGNLH
jgi:D-alanyl-D-alanine carboxypeptidase (penicillin-binding protein 4)